MATSGDLTYDFVDGTLTVTFLGWLADYSLLDNQRGEYALRHLENGPSVAAYTATETEISVAEADVSALAVEYTAQGGGPRASDEEMVVGLKGFIAQPVEWTYTCTADELVLTPVVEEGVTPSLVVLHHR